MNMTIEEGFSIQCGMNFNVANKEYGIILTSVRKNAPYADRFEDNGTTIIYEGHGVQQSYAPAGSNPKEIDKPMTIPSELLLKTDSSMQ